MDYIKLDTLASKMLCGEITDDELNSCTEDETDEVIKIYKEKIAKLNAYLESEGLS